MAAHNLGEVGEDTLQLWASQVGLTVNKAHRDNRGWDYLVEFPIAENKSEGLKLPLDRVPSPLKCFIQVKSTDGRPGKWSVKLDNLTYLVKSPYPAFFLIFEFDSQDAPQRAYLVHIGEDLIRTVLKRLRILNQTDISKLHKHTLSFRYSIKDVLPFVNGAALQKAILNYVGDNAESYATRKIQMINAIGYENGNTHLSLNILLPRNVEDIQEYLVDFSLGLVPFLECMSGESRDVRFGLAASEPTAVIGQGKVQIVKLEPIGKGTIVLKTSNGKYQLRFDDCDVYTPQGIGPAINHQFVKVRYAVPFIDFTFQRLPITKSEFRYRLPKAIDEYQLHQLRYICQFVQLLNAAHTEKCDVELENWFNSIKHGDGRFSVLNAIDNMTLDYVSTINNAYLIAKHFDVNMLVVLKPIDLMKQRGRLTFIKSVVSSNLSTISIVFRAQGAYLNEGKPVCVPFAIDTTIGQYYFAIAIAIVGEPKPTGVIGDDGIEFEIVTKDIRIVREYINRFDIKPQNLLEDMLPEVTAQYEEIMDIIHLNNLNAV